MPPSNPNHVYTRNWERRNVDWYLAVAHGYMDRRLMEWRVTDWNVDWYLAVTYRNVDWNMAVR